MDDGFRWIFSALSLSVIFGTRFDNRYQDRLGQPLAEAEDLFLHLPFEWQVDLTD